jgi:hypothetical protein
MRKDVLSLIEKMGKEMSAVRTTCSKMKRKSGMKVSEKKYKEINLWEEKGTEVLLT